MPRVLRRTVPPLLSLVFLAAALVAAPPTQPARAAVVAPFAQRFSVNTNGAIRLVGNTLMRCPATDLRCTDALAGRGSALNNNTFVMERVDVDGDPLTFTSSAASLSLPAGANILYAALHWGGDTSRGNKGEAAPDASRQDRVLLAAPGRGYTEITADRRWSVAGGDYAAVADGAALLALVRAAGSGSYRVANVQAGTGEDRDAGWALVVAYADATEPVRSLTVFDGFAQVAQGESVTIDVSGFLTPASGPVRTRLGVVAYEGDRGSTGDSLALGGVTVADPLRPSSNFFNSSISDLGADTAARTPAFANQLGFDVARVDASGVLANGATSTKILLKTGGEAYFPAAVTFSTELFSPRLPVVKSVTDLDGPPTRPGDVVEYTLAVTNDGTDAAVATELRDTLPAGLTIDPGSVETTGHVLPPATSVTASGRELTVRLGLDAGTTAGGRFPIGATGTVRFRATVDPLGQGEAERTLANVATVSARAEVSGLAVEGSSNVETVVVTDPRADLRLAKVAADAVPTLDGTQAAVGGSASFTLTLTNTGPSAADGPLVIEDRLPAGWLFESLTGAGWTCVIDPEGVGDRGFARCSSDGLAPGAVAPAVTARAQVPLDAASGPATNEAVASSPTPDQVPGDNGSSAVVDVVPVADLSLVKSGPESVVAGQTLQYQLVTRNAGPSTATALTVTDVLPAGTTFVGAGGPDWTCTPPAPGSSTLTCAFGRALAPGQSAPVLEVRLTADAAAPASLTNGASVAAVEHDPDTADNESAVTTAAARVVDLAVALTRPSTPLVPGAPAGPNLTVLVTNLGPSSLSPGSPVTVTVDLPPGVVYGGVSPDPAGWACVPTTNAGSTRVTCSLTAPAEVRPGKPVGELVLDVGLVAGATAATATAEVDTPADANDDNDRASTDLLATAVEADLVLAAGPPASTVAGAAGPGPELTFTVTNGGPSQEPGPIEVLLSVPFPLTAASFSPGWDCQVVPSPFAETRLRCRLVGDPTAPDAPLPPGAAVQLAVGFAPLAAEVTPRSLPVVGRVAGTVSDPVPANDAATSAVEVTALADVVALKTVGGASTSTTRTFEIGVRNDGPSVARSVSVTDRLGNRFRLVSVTPTAPAAALPTCTADGALVQCSVDQLGVGESLLATLVIEVDPTTIGEITGANNTSFAGTATPQPAVSPRGCAFQDRTNDSCRRLLAINARPSLTLSKTLDSPVPLPVGSTATFRLQPGNDGPWAARLTLRDTLPAGLTALSASGEGWTCDVSSAPDTADPTVAVDTVTCDRPELVLAGDPVAPVLVEVLVGAVAAPGVTNTATSCHLCTDVEGVGVSASADAPVVSVADLAVDLAGERQVVAGGGATWTAVARNEGPSDEPGPVRMVLTFPPDVTPTAAGGDGWLCAVGQTVTCDQTGAAVLPMRLVAGQVVGVGLPNGEATAPVTVSGRIAPAAGDVTVVSEVRGTLPETRTENNLAQLTSVTTGDADVSLTKSVDDPAPTLLGPVTFRLTVTNAGPAAAAGVVVSDPLPAGWLPDLAASDARCAVEVDSVLRCSAGDLDPGQSTTFVVVAVPPAGATGVVVNVATVASLRDPDPSDDRAEVAVALPTPTTSPPTAPPSSTTLPGTLPSTGADPRGSAAAAVALTLAGLAVLAVAGRRRGRAG